MLSTLVEMMKSVAKTESDPEAMKRYPFHLLFHSEASMNKVLKEEFKYDDADIERFDNLYLTPFFPLCAYEMVKKVLKSFFIPFYI